MLSTRLLRGSFIAALLALAGTTAAHAANVTFSVVAARSEPTSGITAGDVVASYKYLINIDNTGSTEQRSPDLGTGCNPADTGVDLAGKPIRYPDTCHWTSIAGAASHSPVYAQGDQADIAGGALTGVPTGRYLLSVLAEGYKLDGRHFTVDSLGAITWAGDGDQGKIYLQPSTLPDAQIQAEVFEDVSPVNSAPDVPAEHGLAGFQGHILDVLGEVTTNVYGDPLCTTYNTDPATGKADLTSIKQVGGRCLSACYVVDGGVDVGTVAPLDAAGRCPLDPTLANGNGRPMLEGGTAPTTAAIEGKVKIPNLGTNRYTLSVTPPDGSGWIQTTTLEGNHDWDAWVMEGATGLDTEFVVAGEPFPAIIFGYIPTPGSPSGAASPEAPSLAFTDTSVSGKITGIVDRVKIYVPTTGGVPGLPGAIWGGLQGAKIDKPEDEAWITLSDLNNGDTIVYSGKANPDGTFKIDNVPDGSYTLTWWDEPQNQILDLVNVSVANGEAVDMGILPLSGWWTVIDGYVYNDTNRNGVREAGEPGLAGYTLTMRRRENSLMDRGSTVISTDSTGYYRFESAYPMTQYLVEEAYDDGHYTTGITYQADNQPTPTTILGAGVDVSVHPIIGLSGTLDWGKHTYDATGRNGIDPRNGGIVGTVSYDTTRNELDPRYAAVEDWQPSMPDLVVKLFKPVPCGTSTNCDTAKRYQLDTDGSVLKGQLLNTYLTETWQRPTSCKARDLDGNELVPGANEQFLAPGADGHGLDAGCIESPLLGIQFGAYETDQGTPDANFGATVDGNYGFGDGCFVGTLDATDPSAPVCTGGAFTALPAGDYLVQVDLESQKDVLGRPVFKVTREEDINIGNGDNFVPAVPPPACAGALHTVDVMGLGTDGPNATYNPTFVDIGGSPYEGQQRPLCDTKLVSLANGKSIAPAFNVFTDVPLPGRHWFIIIDDLNFSSNPKSTTYGEKAGMPFVPVGIYDYTDRLVTTVESDYNGLADVLLPSTNRIACPTPSGVCTNLYRYVGNDPGVPGRLNLNFNPNFRTIAAEFEVMPGSIVPADLAPTQVGVTVQLPGGQVTSPVQCLLDASTPQLYSVSTPVVASGGSFTINGKGFGASRGTGSVTLDGAALVIPSGSWSDTQIVAQVGSVVGPHQLRITSGNGQSTVNGLTMYVTGAGYSPAVFEVGPGRAFSPADTLPATANHAIQRALNAAASSITSATSPSPLVVVYPNNPSANPRQNPRGAYYENLIINARVKLQGVGPGSPDGVVRGSIIDGGAFAGDSPVATDWYTTLGAMSWAGNQTVFDGAVISLFLPATGNRAFPVYTAGAFDIRTAPSIDGFDLRGGDQQGFPGNINVPGAVLEPGIAGTGPLTTQGGAVFANAYARNLQITNNVVQNNGGAYGTIRIGTPDLPAASPNHNENVVIAYNRVVNNGGTNLAGGIGLFNGSDAYQVAHNDICGNFSAEYGGGISALGMSPGGTIDSNRVYFNRSYDEGGGIMVAGSLPANVNSLSPGSGPVTVSNNLIQANLSNDDGGGLRFLMAGNFPMNVFNNFIVNNISTHEGGGIALNDAPNVRVFNNTIMKNLTTATAITSNGLPAPAGLSTSTNSAMLQATLPVGAPGCSTPLQFNNIYWDNRAGTRAGSGVTGLGVADAVHWDLGSADACAPLAPTNSFVQQNAGAFPYVTSPTNSTADPLVVSMYDIGVTFNAWRNNPAFLGAIMISADLPPNLMGNYHLTAGSPASNFGAASKAVPAYQQAPASLNAPARDYDGDVRVSPPEAGADELPSAQANLGITITDNATAVNVGQALVYTVTVSNAGPAAVSGSPVTVTSSRLAFGAWTCSGNCTIASGFGSLNTAVNLASGASTTITVNGTVTAGTGNLVTTANVVAAGAIDPNLANNTATDTDSVRTPVDLSITKTDGVALLNRGAQVRYTIVVRNIGANPVTGATVTDAFPTGNNLLTGTISWTCATTGGATCGGGGGGNGNINRTVNLPVGSTITYTTTGGRLSTAATATSLVNTATVGVPAATYQDTNTADNSATDTDAINRVHVGALAGTGSISATNNTQWFAQVIVTVHDINGAAVSGVTVNGNWNTNSGNGSANCTTGASGTCTVTRTALSRTSIASVTYSVSNMTNTTVGPYQASSNVVSSVLVARPAVAPIAPAALLRPAAAAARAAAAR